MMKRRQHGFTLIELIVTMTVLSILLGMAVPTFQEVSLNSKLRSHANSLVASAMLARSEAIKRNGVVRMCVSTNGTSCSSDADASWEQGWVVLHENTVIRHESPASPGFKILSTVNNIAFQPSGVGASQATLKVCRATPSVGSQDRQVTISATGRTSVDTKYTATCS
ncbi:GspH/FimT family pseudopilin [Marinimicrobium sp. ABcell2]|uniref:GspH/FimT family pseudopilin n=1 Tax=Marinimicrobium sp. ABcell2 TaxID=3069751 RepID=UPI0027B25435|nr:GspH/FimT family pseudopilin [Marinimicrobium sp. ABcell2]MDQ2075646.1 GspH/FimT family pseudopilin [Marinimicrobium sp. ABcell2]